MGHLLYIEENLARHLASACRQSVVVSLWFAIVEAEDSSRLQYRVRNDNSVIILKINKVIVHPYTCTLQNALF